MKLISRSEWGARPPKQVTNLNDTSDGWFWHWLGTPAGADDKATLRSAQNYHMDNKGWSDIAYNYAVGRDGTGYELRGFKQGGATYGYNKTSLAIVFLIGGDQKPTPAQFRTAYAIMAMTPTQSDQVRPHKDVVTTSCPGPDVTKEIRNPQYKGRPLMTDTNHKAFVGRLYTAILGRPADEAGLNYWADGLSAGHFTQLDVTVEFLAVQAAANKAAFAAQNQPGADPQTAADAAYAKFVANLAELNK